MKKIAKYFLAIVPYGEIQEKVQNLKEEIRDDFGVKYALKSPAHVTLKMPFVYNEAKESQLISKLKTFLTTYKSFVIKIDGTQTFGRRVIFWRIKADTALFDLQSELKLFCKQKLNLVDELADRNFTPHLTIAFKDLKSTNFDGVLGLVKKGSISENMDVNTICLLKRIDRRWIVIEKIPLSL